MRLLTVLASSAVFSFGLLAITTSDARADDAQPAAAQQATNEKLQPKDKDDDIKHISLEVNPLGLAIGRYSISGEYVIVKHHAVTITPFYANAPVTVTVNGKELDGGALTGFGGELGYRFYTGSKGANGFFVGPSALFGSYSQSAPGGGSSQSFSAIGGALDIGGQAILGPGIVIGGGFGLQYTKNSEELDTGNLNLASAVIAGGGIRPRFLLSAGYSF